LRMQLLIVFYHQPFDIITIAFFRQIFRQDKLPPNA